MANSIPLAFRAAAPDGVTATADERARVLGKAVVRAAAALGLNGPDLAAVLGVSTASVSRLPDGKYLLSGKPFELAACLVRVFRSLDAIVHGDGAAMKAWMRGPNSHLHAIPREEVKTAQGLVRVMAYLDATRAPL